MVQFKNWKCYSYRIDGKEKRDYSYQELKPYFYIDGSEVVYCKKDFGNCKAGRYYLVSDGSFYGCGFVIHKQEGFTEWTDKEYMKAGEKNE